MLFPDAEDTVAVAFAGRTNGSETNESELPSNGKLIDPVLEVVSDRIGVVTELPELSVTFAYHSYPVSVCNPLHAKTFVEPEATPVFVAIATHGVAATPA